jgi:hypothetical protein
VNIFSCATLNIVIPFCIVTYSIILHITRYIFPCFGSHSVALLLVSSRRVSSRLQRPGAKHHLPPTFRAWNKRNQEMRTSRKSKNTAVAVLVLEPISNTELSYFLHLSPKMWSRSFPFTIFVLILITSVGLAPPSKRLSCIESSDTVLLSTGITFKFRFYYFLIYPKI